MKYKSKGRTVSESRCHKGLWIVECAGGTFYAISSTEQIIKLSHPPDPQVIPEVVTPKIKRGTALSEQLIQHGR